MQLIGVMKKSERFYHDNTVLLYQRITYRKRCDL